jgi:hypothetical protein
MAATETLGLDLDWWDDSVGAFDPTKVLRQIARVFPQVEIDPTDHQDVRLQRELVAWSQGVSDETVRESLIRQSKGLYRRTGPCFRFEIPFTSGHRVKGQARRCAVLFTIPRDLPAAIREQLSGFLSGLEMGHPTWRRDGNDDEEA